MSPFSFKSLALSVCLFSASGVMASTDTTTCPSPELIQKTFVDNNQSWFTEIDVNLISFDVNTSLFNTLVLMINLNDDDVEAFQVANIKASFEYFSYCYLQI